MGKLKTVAEKQRLAEERKSNRLNHEPPVVKKKVKPKLKSKKKSSGVLLSAQDIENAQKSIVKSAKKAEMAKTPAGREKLKFGTPEWRDAATKCGVELTDREPLEDGSYPRCQNVVTEGRVDENGVPRCKWHGGVLPDGARKSYIKRKGAKTIGRERYRQQGEDLETITYDALTREEQELWDRISTSPVAQLEHDLKVITIREKRMLDRINDLIEEGRMSVIESSDEVKDGENGIENKRVKKKSTNLERIQAIEGELTRLNKQKVAIMEALERARNGAGGGKLVTVGGRKGSPVVVANIDLSQIPTEELQRQLAMLEGMDDD